VIFIVVAIAWRGWLNGCQDQKSLNTPTASGEFEKQKGTRWRAC
jgi:hypothetical protein